MSLFRFFLNIWQVWEHGEFGLGPSLKKASLVKLSASLGTWRVWFGSFFEKGEFGEIFGEFGKFSASLVIEFSRP